MTFLTPILLLLALPCFAWLWLWRIPGRYLHTIRTIWYIALVLALARPALLLRSGGGTVVVVADRSASLPPEALRQQESLIQLMQSRRGVDDRLGVVSFASRAVVEHPPQGTPFATFSAAHEPDASNLSDALSTGLSLIAPGTPGRLLILSDGCFTGSDPQTVAGMAATRGIPLDYRLQTRSAASDTAVVRVDAPQEIRKGESLLATAWIESPLEQQANLTVRRGSAIVMQGTRRLPKGLSPLMFRDSGDRTGVQSYTVTIETADKDPYPENNRARFLTRFTGSKPLLCVPATPASRLPQLLARGGVEVATLQPENVDNSLEALASYSGIVIENTRADRIGPETLRTIEAWVRHAGAGVLVTGGRNAYGLGGYYRSALEPALPVTMELRREHRKFSMAIAVVLDRSGSMAVPVAGGKTKMDLANLGTMEVLNLLSDQDEMAVIAVDSSPHIIVNRLPVSQVRGQQNRILGIQSEGGGIFIYEALKAASLQMVNAQTGVKHILLFADAADSEEPGKYESLIANAVGAGMTISVIGLGSTRDCDATLLQDIAKRGGGSCSFTENALEVPRLFAQDTFMVARNTLITNAVKPRFTLALSQLSDALPSDAPAVGGYNLCYLRPEATAIAVTTDENQAPLVAMRQHGSGRALAFTSEADGEFSGPFAKWPHIGEFYSALARHCAGPLNDGSSGFLPIQSAIPGGVKITVYADTTKPEMRATDGLMVDVLRHRPGNTPSAERIKLPWRSADTLEAEIALKGSETLLATLVYPDGRTEGLPPVCLPYSPEYSPTARRNGAGVLAALAEATEGKQVADVGGIWQTIPREKRWVEISPYFYLFAAILFLFEIFERRTGWLATRTYQKIPTTPTEPVAAESNESPAPQGRPASTPAPASPSKPASAPVPSQPVQEESPLVRAKRKAREQNR